jgi:poly(A)-specific ribonuclease
MVNVTKANFVEQSNDLLKHLPTAAFIAVDEEMTGISMPGTGRPPKEQAPFQRYPILKQVPERYAIIQLGICLFHPVDPNAPAAPVAQVEPPVVAAAAAAAAGVPISPMAAAIPTIPVDQNTPALPFAPAAPILNTNMLSGSDSSNTSSAEWQVRRYNFYMFPGAESSYNSTATREVVLNPSAVSFLNQHNMSFDLWSKQGIPYSTQDQADAVLEKYVRKQQEVAAAASTTDAFQPTIQESSRSKVNLRRRDDIEFFSRAMGSLRDWLDAPAAERSSEGDTYLMPACNSFLRRAFYESIRQQYPSLICENAAPVYPNQIRILRLNTAEKKARDERLRREGWEDIVVNKIGMWRVFAALSAVCRGEELPRQSVTFAESYDQVDWNWQAYNTAPTRRRIPLIVHNGFMDILFMLTHFCQHKLPDSYVDTKELIRQHFPIVYDTKVVATECSTPWNNEMTNLSNLFQKIVRGALESKIAVVTDNSNDPASQDQEHEAAYDAYMTGAIYIGLCKYIKDNHISTELKSKLSSTSSSIKSNVGEMAHLSIDDDDAEIRTRFGRNKLFQMSMFTMDLETATVGDPLSMGMLPDCTYRVAGIDPSVSTRDIVQCVSALRDDSGRTVNFELVWVDDTTFLVAANYKKSETDAPLEDGEVGGESVEEDMTAVLKDHGKRLFEALRIRFPIESIITLEKHLKSLEKKKAKPTFMSRVWNLFGFGPKKRDAAEAEGDGPAPKRRRMN